ncbi:MAG TPA: transcriptional regulator [Candidatus Latescibacteria bacterium]|nr:transcriptional regulator [Candidatus Latescibacterota bacterium]
MLEGVKEDSLVRLRRIAGQVGGIQRMVEEEKYCIDILTQIAAVRAALDKVGLIILRGHLETCVTRAIKENKGEELIDELDSLLSKFLR